MKKCTFKHQRERLKESSKNEIKLPYSCCQIIHNNFPRLFRKEMSTVLPYTNVTARYRTRNTLDCDQSNYFSRIVFSPIPIEFGQTGNSAIRSAGPVNPTVEPNMKWIGRPLAEILPFEIFPNVRSRVGRRSPIGRYYILLTLISYSSSLR